MKLKELFKKSNTRTLTVVFLDVRKQIIEMESFSDIFDFFNYLAEHNIKRLKWDCFDPKEGKLLIHYNHAD